jgi:hypothetical protein
MRKSEGETSDRIFFTIFCLDSDDSDNKGWLGNVERLVMRSPNTSKAEGKIETEKSDIKFLNYSVFRF